MSKYEPSKNVGRESDKFQVRLPDGMRDAIAASGKENGRSMNAEIVARLEQSFAIQPKALLSLMATHVGLIQFLAESLEEVAKLVPTDSPAQVKVAMILKLSNSLSIDATQKR